MWDVHVKSVEDDLRILVLAIVLVATANFDSIHDSESFFSLEKCNYFLIPLFTFSTNLRFALLRALIDKKKFVFVFSSILYLFHRFHLAFFHFNQLLISWTFIHQIEQSSHHQHCKQFIWLKHYHVFKSCTTFRYRICLLPNSSFAFYVCDFPTTLESLLLAFVADKHSQSQIDFKGVSSRCC